MKAQTLDEARAARDAGIAQALQHADAEVSRWSDLAYLFLLSYCRRQAEIFTGEDLVDASVRYGIVEPPTPKAWGGIVRRAARRGVIEKVDNAGVRRKGHCSPCPRWRSLIYGKPAG